MILTVNDQRYIVHFRYSEDERHRRVTECGIHRGNCVGKPCQTLDTAFGRIACSKKDVFIKRVGMKAAFERALWLFVQNFLVHADEAQQRGFRQSMWAAFFEKSPRTLPAKQVIHK